MNNPKIIAHSSNEEFVHSVIDIISKSAIQAIENRGKFNIVLTGGETPRLIYRGLAKIATDWSLWEFYLSDERCVPKGNKQLNQLLIREELLDLVPVSESQVHFIDAGLDIGQAVNSYSQKLEQIQLFDLTILGIGEDGHVASLFAGNDIGTEADSPDVLPVHNSPKPPPERISLSANRLNRSLKVLIIASGNRKREIITKYLNRDDMPASHIKGLQETMLLYCID